MGVEYDVYHNVVYFLLYSNCENYMKSLNYYGYVVGVYICYVHICCWCLYMLRAYMLLVNFLICYWC